MVKPSLQTAVQLVKEADELTLPGIVIPYPLSQLMLHGISRIHITPEKPSEVYDKFQGCEWLWLIEGHARSSKLPAAKMFDPLRIGPPEGLTKFPARPAKPQIVGLVRFGASVLYKSKDDFDEDDELHFVPADHASAWGEQTTSRVGWRIRDVCMLLQPVPFIGNAGCGFSLPRRISVQFAVDADRLRVVADLVRRAEEHNHGVLFSLLVWVLFSVIS